MLHSKSREEGQLQTFLVFWAQIYAIILNPPNDFVPKIEKYI